MVSSIGVGFTYSKYVVDDYSDDTARISRFGVTTGVAAGAFSTTYKNSDGSLTTVSSANTDKVLAPGTKGTFSGIHISGTPEVDVRVTTSATVTLTGWELADGTFYCPLKVKVGSTTMNGLNYSTANSFSTAIYNAIASIADATYDSGTDLSAIPEYNRDYSWEWPFKDSTGSKVNQSADNDTYLGDQAAAGNAATFSITVSAKVEQID